MIHPRHLFQISGNTGALTFIFVYRDVLSYDIISYLTYEGVNISETLEIASRQNGADLKPFLRRQHLVVTAIREFIQALETYGNVAHLSKEDKDFLLNLQSKFYIQ